MSEENVYWYVLFAKTGQEERLVDMLTGILRGLGTPFIPLKTCVFRRQGQKSLFRKICFPGYIFIESNKSAVDFLAGSFPILYKTRGVYRFLHYGDDRLDVAMRENERKVLESFLGRDRCIDISTGFREGDSIRVIAGPLVGSESRIIKVNKKRHEVATALDMFGNSVEVVVGIEFIEKAD